MKSIKKQKLVTSKKGFLVTKVLWQKWLPSFGQLSFEEFGLKQLSIITHLKIKLVKSSLQNQALTSSDSLRGAIAIRENWGTILNFDTEVAHEKSTSIPLR